MSYKEFRKLEIFKFNFGKIKLNYIFQRIKRMQLEKMERLNF